MKYLYAILLMAVLPLVVFSQTKEKKKPIQISGLVMTADSIPQFMPYVNIKITPTKDGVTKEQKSELIEGVAKVLKDVLGKPESLTTVIIDEIDLENWGSAGKQVTQAV